MNNVFDGAGPYTVQVFHDKASNEVVVRSGNNPDITLNPHEVIDLYNKLNELKDRK